MTSFRSVLVAAKPIRITPPLTGRNEARDHPSHPREVVPTLELLFSKHSPSADPDSVPRPGKAHARIRGWTVNGKESDPRQGS